MIAYECHRCHTKSDGAGFCFCQRGGVLMAPVFARYPHSVDPGPVGPVRAGDPDYAAPVHACVPGVAPREALGLSGNLCRCGREREPDRTQCALCVGMDTPEDE